MPTRYDEENVMASSKQTSAAKENIKKATEAAKKTHSIASMPKSSRTALGKQGAAVAARKRSGGSEPKTRAELYKQAQRANIPGRSKMGREELQRALARSK
jgi:hypothetical protein